MSRFATLFLLVAATLGLVAWRATPPTPRPAANTPAGEFSAERADAVLQRVLAGEVPHPIGTAENAVVRERVVQELRTLGLDPQIQTATACSRASCGTVHNVVARIEPTKTGAGTGPAILLATHYDSVGAGPGASDAGVSVAALIETARALLAGAPGRPIERPVILLVDDGEEAGLLGARAFAAEHPWAGDVGVVVNLEARGTRGQSFLFETSDDNAWLIDAFARESRRPATSSIFYSIYSRLPNDTDLTVFKAHGWQGINFAFIGAVPRYHTPQDNLAHRDLRSLQHHGDHALAAVRGLLASPHLAAPPPGRAVWFDVLSLGIVRWPERFTLPLAIAALLSTLLAAALLSRRGAGPIRFSALGWGAASFGTAMVSGAGVAFAMVWALRRAGVLPLDWVSAGLSLQLAIIAGAAAAALAIAGPLARRAGFLGSWAAAWILLGVLGIVLASFDPSAAYVAVVPALVAGASGIAFALTTSPQRSAAALTAIACLVLTVLVGPFVWLLYDAMGAAILFVSGLLVGQMIATALPLIGATTGDRRAARTVVLALVAVAILAAVRVAVAPSATPDLPERMTLRFVQETGEGRSSWFVSPESGRLPDSLRRAGFGVERVRTMPWSRVADGFRADAGEMSATAFAPLEAPEAEILHWAPAPAALLDPAATPAAGREVRDLRLRLRSQRGAPIVVLGIPPGLDLVDARWNERAFEDSGKRATVAGAWTFRVGVTTPPEGSEVWLRLARPAPSESGATQAWSAPLLVYDQSPDLPTGAERWLAARPSWGSPSGWGDTSLAVREITLPAEDIETVPAGAAISSPAEVLP